MFANVATPIYFTHLLGEPRRKMLRYQQQYSFFEPAKLEQGHLFFNPERPGDGGGFKWGSIEQISSEVDTFKSLVFWWRTPPQMWCREGSTKESENCKPSSSGGLLLTSWESGHATIREYSEEEMLENPVFTVADGIFRLTQNVERNSVVRKMQIIKMRGQSPVPGAPHHPGYRSPLSVV